ncbi:MAG: hypothetical protein LBL07_08755 [Tannerella sp.]|jgi:hypothetical protein|nr:hypothetical protein [Tannerella sp.]
MAGLHDWLPSNHEALINKATQTVTFLTAAVFARIGVAGAALMWYQDKFMIRYNRFKAAFENRKNPAERTPVKTTVLQETKEEFIKVYRILHGLKFRRIRVFALCSASYFLCAGVNYSL